MCYKNIMRKDLDHVIQTVHLKKDDCNIFLIGEHHDIYNNFEKCKGIRYMFQDLERYIKHYKSVKIDLMIEINENDVKTIDNIIFNDEVDNQMNQVRKLFMRCIVDSKYTKDKKLCGNLNVHWLDPIISDDHKTYEHLPEWFKIFQRFISKNKVPPNFNKNPNMWKDFNPSQNKEHLIKILTENIIVMKEIDKAFKKNIFFERSNITKIFIDLNKKNLKNRLAQQNQQDLNYIYYFYRSVMDFYTIARIIKSDMKKVIIYAGIRHVENIVYILTEYLEFKKISVIEGTCQP